MKKVLGYLFYIIGFYFLYVIVFSGFPLVSDSAKFDGVATTVGVVIALILFAIPVFFLLKFANRWTKLKRSYFWGILALVSLFGFISEEEVLPFNHDNEYVIWSEKNVDWSNFTEVVTKSDGFSASIYSEIFCPREITKKSSAIYAYMSPEISDKLNDSLLDPQLLIHEQYHFNITEYYARLLRKAIIEIGSDEVTIDDVQSLYDKYESKRDSVQIVYDSISEHNVKNHEQRYWELKIDELLRETAYYTSPDLNQYYDFNKSDTDFYREIYQTIEGELLTSYPMTKEEVKYGEAYEVLKSWDNNIVVKFYNNGKLTNGGDYKSAITKINKNWWGDIEIQYYNADNTFNTDRAHCVFKSIKNDNDIRVSSYFNASGERVNNTIGVFETHWETISDSAIYGSYFDENGEMIRNGDSIYHLKRAFDAYGRLVVYESFDEKHKLMNDKDGLAVYNYKYDKHHKVVSNKMFDKNRKFPLHIGSYNLRYTYDERGFLKKSINLNKDELKINDSKGISVYDYCYDMYGNRTQTKRYNKMNSPVLGNEDYFQWVTRYDSLSRVVFDAKYLLANTLKFNKEGYGASKNEYLNDSITLNYNLDAYNNIIKDNNGIAIIKYQEDSSKKIVKEFYFDEKNNFATTDNEVVQYNYKYDEKGNEIENISLDSLGNIKSFQKDVAIVRWEYDANNNKIKTTYYNEEDKLAHANLNATFNFYSYNSDNKVIERSYYNKKMEPLMYEGAFKTMYLLNKKGKDSLIKKYDINNDLIKGVCITKYKYNVYDNVIVESYYNDENSSANNSDGISAIKYNYDNRQRVIGHDYFDIHDSIVNNKQGYSTYKNILNENGDIVSESFFNKIATPVLGPNGYHKKEAEWNEMDLNVKITLFNVDNALIEDDEGIAIYEFPRATSSLLKVDRFYNKNHELTEDNSGVAEIYYQPNLNGLYYLDKKLNAKGEVIK
ncbi:MAG: hypothetical protein HRT69_10825 [Flavobacteriaceae bacterium]|nr:hypothetical protein [Flavobacteriaceae bacterium]